MTPVEQRVVELLRTFHDARQAWDARSGGGGVLLMPSMWNEGSYRELERVLAEMRDSRDAARRLLWWHVCARYIWTELRLTRVPVRRTRKGPSPIVPPLSELDVIIAIEGREAKVRLTIWDELVDPALVDEGVSVVASLMYNGDAGRVVLPSALRDRARAS